MIHSWIVLAVFYIAASAAIPKTAGAERYAVRVVRDVAYLQGVHYDDNKDKLDIYLPEGRRNAPVIVSYYGNQLMGGDKTEDAYIGRRFAAAGFVTAVVNYRLSPEVSHPAHIQDAAASFAWVKRHIADYSKSRRYPITRATRRRHRHYLHVGIIAKIRVFDTLGIIGRRI